MIDFATIPLGHGVGTENRPCTIAAVNLARNGQLSDRDPDGCMSEVVRRWVINVQDAMPVEMLAPDDAHGIRWRQVAPSIAGSRTSGPSDDERMAMIVDWMWDCLGWRWREWVPTEAHDEWEQMLAERTSDAATAAALAAAAAPYVVLRAEYAGRAAREPDKGRPYSPGDIAAYAAAAATYPYTVAIDEFWRAADPAALLAKLTGSSS